MLPTDLLNRFARLVDANGILTDPADMQRYLVEWRGLYEGRAAAILRPRDTMEVAAILRLANETRTAIVPQGGNTGLVGGQIPDESGSQIVLSLERLTRVRTVDADNNTMTVEAGLTLAAAQQVARDHGRLFPLSLASEGSCQIGGNLSTNAGGTAVLHYGNARDLVLGLEVVLADGEIWDGLGGLRKDNTGYDLKQLFLGSEGTLGIITAATLKLFPAPAEQATALIGLGSPKAAVRLLRHLERTSGGLITSFELMPRIALDLVLRHIEGTRDPLSGSHPWYALVELSSGAGEQLAQRLQTLLSDEVAGELVADAAIAQNEAQRAQLWRLRESISEAQKREGGSIKHDVSVPVSRIDAFIAEAVAAVTHRLPGIRPVPFGHLGDGNIHFNLSQPVGADASVFVARWDEFNALVHEIVLAHGGSISAEHGVGRLKRDEIARLKPPVAMRLMRDIKRTLDPNNILNPGKVV